MLALGVGASDLLFLCCAFMGGAAVATPLATFVAVAQNAAPKAARSRRRHSAADAGYRGPERRKHSAWTASSGPAFVPAGPAIAMPLTPAAAYAAQLRRAAPVVRLYAAAPPGGEKEAAYHALVRLAAAVNAARGAPSVTGSVTPGAIYRDLTRLEQWPTPEAGTLAFDARICAELNQRDDALMLA